MASPKTIKMNESIPKPTPVMYRVGDVNWKKAHALLEKKELRGNAWGKRRKEKKVEAPQIKYLPVSAARKNLWQRIWDACKMFFGKRR
jgi:hypothetical protein